MYSQNCEALYEMLNFLITYANDFRKGKNKGEEWENVRTCIIEHIKRNSVGLDEKSVEQLHEIAEQVQSASLENVQELAKIQGFIFYNLGDDLTLYGKQNENRRTWFKRVMYRQYKHIP